MKNSWKFVRKTIHENSSKINLFANSHEKDERRKIAENTGKFTRFLHSPIKLHDT
jgi:hypothetical protein